MVKGESIEAREAKYREKMIEVKVRFWTNKLSTSGQVIPKHGWTSGVVRITSNKSHGITAGKARPFNSLLDLGAAIEQILKEHGIVLHVSRGMKKYISQE
ncbi:MAG: hypothetical protein ACHP8B_05965 [Terriglobales bacterium]